MKKSKKKDLVLDEYDEDIKKIEEEMTEDYVEDYKKESNKLIKTLNIVFIVLIVLMVMITIDIVAVARYNAGPFFAIKTKTYKDGGTKVYYGVGYKVIKYKQVQGRRDMTIGFWTMPYNVEPLNTSSIDLAIEFTENPSTSYERYYKKFIRIDSTLRSINEKDKTISLDYIDEDGKYTLGIVCEMADNKIPSNLEKDKEITIIGTVSNFKLKTDNSNNKLYISNCFAEQ